MDTKRVSGSLIYRNSEILLSEKDIYSARILVRNFGNKSTELVTSATQHVITQTLFGRSFDINPYLTLPVGFQCCSQNALIVSHK
jgi:hypothetical protein